MKDSQPKDGESSSASRGGKARAKNLSAARRKEIARKAAMARWDNDGQSAKKLSRATHQGNLQIGDLNLRCFVLENGKRVISGRTMTTAIGMKGRGQGTARITTHKTLNPFIDSDLTLAIQNPISFIGAGSIKTNPTSGYEASTLVEICEAILNARDAGVLKTEQEVRYAHHCDILMRGFARVGLIALIDEVTGYQAERARNALHQILENYIAKELLPWSKRFPDEFYQEIFRLRGWQYDPMSVKRPVLVGKLTEKIVYERLPYGVLEELKAKNPSVKGKRRHKHHQFLTSDIGHPHLDKHLASVTALMRVSTTWKGFEKLLSKAFPIPGKPNQPGIPGMETYLEDAEDSE
ncbi:P63C domain-containing protein [Sphaerothrix gracilis]|uniref:P63C domain-containing protein n=1 Tax=Sphaerothrix gracilis TaxID=3151835 RepID=UPI0031FCEED1